MPATSEAQAAALLHFYSLSAFVLEPYLNGFYACLALLTVWTLMFKAKSSPRNKIWLLIVIVMFTSATVHSGLTWGYLISAFTNHGAGPYVATALSKNTVWYKAVGDTAFSLNILIADLLFVWRCWVVWEYRWSVIVVPILATVAGQVMAVISIVGQIAVTRGPGTSQVGEHFAKFTTPYIGLSLATSLVTTGLIAFRIVLVQRASRKLGIETEGRFGSYSKVLEILIESAAMYSLNLLVFVVLIARRNTKLSYPELIHPQVAGIATTLIILRVALGHARPDDRWSTAQQTNANVVFSTVSYVETGSRGTPGTRTAGYDGTEDASQKDPFAALSLPNFSTSILSHTDPSIEKEAHESGCSSV